MADGSQQPMQIMETKTRFDVTVAIEKWRLEVAAQPGLTSDNQHELETHLRESVDEFRKRGLNDEESFWLAYRRVGPPHQLSEEFSAADPRRIWRERAFWLALGYFAFQWLGLLCRLVLRSVLLLIPDWVGVYAPLWWSSFWMSTGTSAAFSLAVSVLPFVFLLLLVARGRGETIDFAARCLLRSRRRLILVGTVSVLVLNWLTFMSLRGSTGFALFLAGDSTIHYLVPLAVIAWLMPIQAKPSPAEAVTNS